MLFRVYFVHCIMVFILKGAISVHTRILVHILTFDIYFITSVHIILIFVISIKIKCIFE